VVCAPDETDGEREEYDVAALDTSSSAGDALVAVDEPVDEAAAVEAVLGACAANHAPRPRNEAALTAPVIRRARRAGCGFFAGGMDRA